MLAVARLTAVLLCIGGHVQAAVPTSSFFPFGIPAGDARLPPGDDSSSASIRLLVPFPFITTQETSIVVNVNGVLSFAELIQDFRPNCNPSTYNMRMVAPYWADIDTSVNGGNVYYRQSTEPSLLRKASQEISDTQPGLWGISIRWLFIATWENVTFYGVDCPDKSIPRNTFQVTLATDGKYSFAIMYFNQIVWTAGSVSGGNKCTGLGGTTPAKVGFDAGDKKNFYAVPGSCTADIVNVDETSNVMYPGKWIFRTDTAQVDVKCGGTALRVFPSFIDTYGHVPVEFQGPCFNITDAISCTFHDSVRGRISVPGHAYSSYGTPAARCLAPYLYATGVVTVELTARASANPTGGETRYKTSISVVWELPEMDQFTTEESSSMQLHLTWDKNDYVLFNASEVKSLMLLFDDKSNSWRELALVGGNNNNSNVGDASIPFQPDDLPIDSVELVNSAVAYMLMPAHFTLPVNRDLPYVGGWLSANAVCGALQIYSQYDFKEMCRKWYENDRGPPQGISPCPPLLAQAQVDPNFVQDYIPNLEQFHPGAIASFRSVRFSPSGSGSQCTYDAEGRILVGPRGGGTADLYSPDFHKFKHVQHDVVPWCLCCKRGDNESCQWYYDKRPSQPGNDYLPPGNSNGNGDPHFTTFDRLQYTFNGAGEFWLVKPIDNNAANQFRMQVRTEPFADSSGKTTATVFTAFVGRQGNGSVAQVQLAQGASIDVFIDGFKLSFPDRAMYTQSFNGVTVSMRSSTADSLALSFDTFSFVFGAANGAMSVTAAAQPQAANKYYGLLGNFDSQPENDLRTPDGTVVDPNASLPSIHYDFGLKWFVSQSESLFTYASDLSYNSYYKPSFLPSFIVPDISKLPAEVQKICGMSAACAYDYQSTGSTAFANQTVTNERVFNETVTTLEQEVVMCAPLTRPQNGYMEAKNFFHGSSALFWCETGYTLVGNNVLVCVNGQWNSAAPLCSGSIRIVGSGMFTLLMYLIVGFFKSNY